jgi:hypothetical protein
MNLRRHFPGITDNAQARECARVIAGWKPLPLHPLRRKRSSPRRLTVDRVLPARPHEEGTREAIGEAEGRTSNTPPGELS